MSTINTINNENSTNNSTTVNIIESNTTNNDSNNPESKNPAHLRDQINNFLPNCFLPPIQNKNFTSIRIIKDSEKNEDENYLLNEIEIEKKKIFDLEKIRKMKLKKVKMKK